MLSLEIPDDQPDLLKALGRLAVAHGNLEMVQIMCLKTLDRLMPEQAMDQFRRKGAGYIRKEVRSRIEKSAVQSDLKERKKAVLDMLVDADCLSRRRNNLIHRFWGRHSNGHWLTSGDESNWENLPSVNVIEDFIRAIQRVTARLNRERFADGLIVRLSNP